LDWVASLLPVRIRDGRSSVAIDIEPSPDLRSPRACARPRDAGRVTDQDDDPFRPDICAGGWSSSHRAPPGCGGRVTDCASHAFCADIDARGQGADR
jgi:hypothetical protein